MKIGVSVRIDVSKIDKSRLYKGEKGTYLDVTTFIDTEQQDEYGNNGFVAESVSKDERAQGVKGTILGNSKVFYKDNNQSQGYGNQQSGYQQQAQQKQPQQQTQSSQYPQQPQPDFDDDLAF